MLLLFISCYYGSSKYVSVIAPCQMCCSSLLLLFDMHYLISGCFLIMGTLNLHTILDHLCFILFLFHYQRNIKKCWLFLGTNNTKSICSFNSNMTLFLYVIIDRPNTITCWQSFVHGMCIYCYKAFLYRELFYIYMCWISRAVFTCITSCIVHVHVHFLCSFITDIVTFI